MKKVPYIRIAQLLLLGVALVPCLFLPWIPTQYLILKIVTFRLLVLLSLFFAVVGMFFGSENYTLLARRVRSMLSEKISKTVGVLLVAFSASTFVAIDRAVAFWGTFTRQEGFVGYIFIFVAGLLLYILFTAREWRRFMQISLVVSSMLCVHQVIQLFMGIDRPSSVIGNPIFAAVYYSFTAFFAASLYFQQRNEISPLEKRLYVTAFSIAIVGIFTTASRGVILGVCVSSCVVAFREFRSQAIFKKVAIAGFIFVLLFVTTRHGSVWQYIPGLNRIAATSLSTGTAQSRILLTKISISSFSDSEVPLRNKLFGIGWDNFAFMWQKEYVPALFAHDSGLFDRAHNVFADHLVMNGLFGLGAYLLFWYFIFKKILALRDKDRQMSAAFLWLFGSYFVQNLFVFDTAFTLIFLFAAIAYLLFFEKTAEGQPEAIPRKKHSLYGLKVGFSVVGVVLLSYLFYRASVVSLYQVIVFSNEGSLLEKGLSSSDRLEKALSIPTPATIEFRDALLFKFFQPNPSIPLNDATFPVLQKQIAEIDAYLAVRPQEYQYVLDLAKGYVLQGQILRSTEDLEKAQGLFERALLLAPRRQDTICEYSLFLQKYGDANDALSLLNQSLQEYSEVADTRYCRAHIEASMGESHYDSALEDSEYALSNGFEADASLSGVYKKFITYYYKRNDLERLVVVLTRMKMLDSSQAEMCEAILAYIDQYKVIPKIVFQ